MRENFQFALDHVLVHEGGFADHKDDPGGATMKGVTLAVFRRFFGADKSVEDLKNITHDQLATVYRTGYWDKCRCDELPAGVDYAVFDSAVNSGPGRAAKWLQQAVDADVDGAIGPNTLRQVGRHEPLVIINDLLDARLAFLRRLSTFSVFGRGWTRRVNDVRATAQQLAEGDTAKSAANAAPDVAFPVLRRGSNGDWVSKVQQVLDIAVDGDFGPVTERAVKTFQEHQGLEPDGIVGRLTYRAMGLIA